MAPLMPSVPPQTDPFQGLELDSARPMLIGVLPHTFCNPKVKGCGFCTFPHEKFGREPMRRVLSRVAQEIAQTAACQTGLTTRRVEAVYIGGGTASGRPVRAVQVGGPLGAYFPPSLFDTIFDYEAFTAAGGLIGRINRLGDTYVGIEVAEGVEIQLQRNAIVQVLPKGTVK